jgi:hypothetical protein
MLITFRAADGANVCIVWGDVWSEPYTKKVGKNNLTNTTFFLRYDTKRNGKQLIASTVCVSAWGKYAGQCMLLQKRMDVVVFGLIQRDDYNSTKQKKEIYKVTAQMILPATAVWQAVKEHMADRNAYPKAEMYAEYAGKGVPEINEFDDLMT